MNKSQRKVDMLVEALQYVKKFAGKIIVIKFGGNAMIEKESKDSIFTDIAILKMIGLNVILVHGGGPEVDKEMIAANIPKKVIHGLRVTDKKTLDIVDRVFKTINHECISALKKQGISAQDCTRGLISTIIRDKRLGYVGEIEHIQSSLLIKALKKGYVPVVSSLGMTVNGQLTNINADTTATKIAQSVHAEKLTIITNVKGVRIEGKFLSHLGSTDATKYIASGEITSGMIPKVLSCVDAVKHDVKKAHLINGEIRRALLLELFTEKGIGTEIVP